LTSSPGHYVVVVDLDALPEHELIDAPSVDIVHDSARLGVLRPAGIGFTSAFPTVLASRSEGR
jgi:hypothetical protein